MPHIPSHPTLLPGGGIFEVQPRTNLGQISGNDFNPFDNPFLDFFETDDLGRRAAFQARLPENQTAGQQRFNPFDFEQIMNSFLRRLGTQINTGQVPNATFTGELASQFSTPGQQQRRRARAPVFQSGLGTAGLVGPLRRLFNQ